MRAKAAAAVLAVLVVATGALAEQLQPDPDYRFAIPSVAYERGAGPVVGIDAGHHNYHTADGRFAPFARLIEDDGFRVRSMDGRFDGEALSGIDVLVVANALDAVNVDHWVLPTYSAFTDEEIETVRRWVHDGGALLLIADHMPWAGAEADLGKAFGFGFVNGYAFTAPDGSPIFTFTREDGLILDDLGVGLPPTRSFRTFTGQAFTVPDDAVPLLWLGARRYVAVLPRVAGELDGSPTVDVTGYSQGAVMKYGGGRLAVFGEAGGFTAQLGYNGSKSGMNADGAEDNAGFVLKVMRWLAGYVLPE